jgi:hypothetical protein
MSTAAAAEKPAENHEQDPLAKDWLAALGIPDIESEAVITPLEDEILINPGDDGEETAPEPEKKEPEKPAAPKTVVKRAVNPVEMPAAPPVAPQPQQPAVVPPQPTAEPPVNPPDKLELTEEQEELLEVARFAETAAIPALTGKAKELENYFAKLKTFTEANPDLTEDDDQFRQFVQTHQPSISPTAINRARREMTLAEAEARAKKGFDAELAKIRQENHRLASQPGIEKQVEAVKEDLSKMKVGDDALDEVIKAIAENPEAAAEAHPIEAPIITRTLGLARTYLEINSRVSPYNPDNPEHAKVSNFIFSQADFLKGQPPEKQLRGGKRFADPAEYAQLENQRPDLLHQYWTFTPQDVLKMLSHSAVNTAKRERDKITRAYFKPKNTEKKEQKPAETPESPGLTVAPSGGGSGKAATNSDVEMLRAIIPGYKAQ